MTVESLTRRYADFTAVDDVSFTAPPGRVTGFLGPSAPAAKMRRGEAAGGTFARAAQSRAPAAA